MFPDFTFFFFVMSLVEGKSHVHEYLKMLEDKYSRACKYIEEWEENVSLSEKWMYTIANHIGYLRANKNSRLLCKPGEYELYIENFMKYHTDKKGHELKFPPLEVATRESVRAVMGNAKRRATCVVHYESKIAALTPAIYQWKNILHSLKLSKKNAVRALNLKKGLEPQRRLKDLLVFSMFYDQQKREVINHLLFTEHLTKKCLAKRKIVKPDFRKLLFKLCLNRLYSTDSQLSLPVEMEDMVCGYF